MSKKRVCANAPTLPHRKAMAASTLSPLLVAAVPAHSGAAPVLDPLVPLYKQWKQAETDFLHEHALEGKGNCETAEEIEAHNRMWETAEDISSRVPKTIRGVHAQLQHFIEHYGMHVFGCTKDDLDERLIKNMLVGLEALSAE